MPQINDIRAREIFDSRGEPTVEVDLYLSDGAMGRAAVPSGASTGKYEAAELRDGGDRLGGKGVLNACENVTEKLLPGLRGQEAEQSFIDNKMIDLDGSGNKSNFGANAILGISLALAKALASSRRQPLWEYFHGLSEMASSKYLMPVPMMNILNGGKHANKSADIQEFMIQPVGAKTYHESLVMGASVFQSLKAILKDKGFSTTVGDEGGFAPSLTSNIQAIDLVGEAVEKSGLKFGEDITIALDIAASELYENGIYRFETENLNLDSSGLINMYQNWINKYPVISIEDPFSEDDWDGFQNLTHLVGNKIQIVGDDLFVTNAERLNKGVKEKAGNAILIKLNQIGTVTETVSAIDIARSNGFNAIVSHRSGETEDTTIADFVVGLSTGQIKTGSMSRTDRVAKYNQLLRIEEELGSRAVYPGRSVFNG